MPSLAILIPQPCAESWEAMTPTGPGRHCAACQKTVIDFSLQSDAEILAYLAQATGDICGRLRSDQLNRPLLLLPPVARPAARWRAWVALALAAWGPGAGPATATGHPAPAPGPRTAAHPRKKPGPAHYPAAPAPRRLRGTVRDEATHEPLAGVAVFLKGENRSAVTDSAGQFSLRLPAQRPDPAAAGATIVGYGTQLRQDITGGLLTVAAPEVLPPEELRTRRARSFWQWITQPFRPR